MNKEIKKRKDELLVELKKNVPQIEWEFNRVDEEIKHFKDGITYERYDMFFINFNGTHKESKDDCFIKFDNGRLDVLEVGYYHMGSKELYDGYDGKNTNHKYIRDWDGVNEFFNEYCIGYEGREEKIKSGEMVTPNMSRIKSVGNYHTSKNEYSEGILNLLLDVSEGQGQYFNKELKKSIKYSFDNFEGKHRELFKKKYDKETYERLDKVHKGNFYFGTPIQMVQSFIEDKLEGTMDYWLEDRWNEVEKEELETIKN